MKKTSILSTIVLVFLTVYSISVNANITKKVDFIALQKATKSNNSNEFQIRLNTINLMEKSELTKTELTQLIAEVNDIKTQIKELDGGLYISASALIIILIVLIILI